jgi:PKD repeat protein
VSLKPSKMLGAACLLGLAILLLASPIHPGRALFPNISVVYVTPQPYLSAPNTVTSITISVMLNLTIGESINQFDVRLDYTNFQLANGVVHAQSVDHSNNIFSGGPQQAQPLVDCVDDVVKENTPVCPPGNDVGKVEFQEVYYGGVITGPISALLFTVTFSVVKPGSSDFTFEKVNLYNPGSDLTNPKISYVQYVGVGASFGSSGLVAFYNVLPRTPPAVLVNDAATFDAAGSFDANNTSVPIDNYTWVWDGSHSNFTRSSTITHSFSTPGNYTVTLTVAIRNARTSITRTVTVSPNLGSLDLLVVDQLGNQLRGSSGGAAPRVAIYNTTSSLSPFENATTNNAGQVVFTGLTPGSYTIRFSGTWIVNSTDYESVSGGWQTLDTVYLQVNYPPPPPTSQDYSGYVFIGAMSVGLGAFASVLVWKRRSSGAGARGKTVTKPSPRNRSKIRK